MGTIRKQSITGTLIIYAGALLGLVNTGILLPRLFSTDQVGLVNILMAYATVFAQFSSLGFNSATTRLFPYFRSKAQHHNGFLNLGLSVNAFGFALGFVVFIALSGFFTTQKAGDSALIIEYIYYVIPLFFSLLLFSFLDNYTKVLFNATIGLFLKEFVVRLGVLLAILSYVLNIFDFHQFILGYTLSYALPSFIIIIYLIIRKDFNLRPGYAFITKELRKELISVSLYGIVAGFMGILTINIDRIMVERFLGLDATGIYSTAFFFGSVVALPSRSLTKISSAYLAEAWKKNDLSLIASIYHKSCITQLVVGGLVFVGLMVNLENIFWILDEPYRAGKLVIVFIGLAHLADMASGVSANLLTTSPAYRIHSFLLLGFMLLVIATNFIFIPIWGLVGAAMASFFSKVIHDFLRVFIIYRKYQLFPFSFKTGITLVLIPFSIFVTSFFPVLENHLMDLILRSTLVSLFYVFIVYILRISPDINERIEAYWGIIRRLFSGKQNR
ncbi:MAG: lipopolysaccharide biosynthesis protein [Bacteroidales bacterium]|nr:lipopolysaccharide biosynthesis protein [Bacteroidales bacterium]